MTATLDHRHRGHMSFPALGADYSSAPVTEDVEWQNQGLCRSGLYDPNLWYPDAPNSEWKSGKAISICQTCPVLDKCRIWALTKHEVYGVWGGMSEDDRSAIWKGRAPKRRYLRKPRRTRRTVAA
jgi:WhiB family transcriptional regulator, redox-sensing transcriptional regulator